MVPEMGEGAAWARTRWLGASIVAFALALFSKEHAVVLLGLFVLTDLLVRPSEACRSELFGKVVELPTPGTSHP